MLILIITVVLAIVFSVIQKGLVDVSTSTKNEQSSRAFSAAEAGIEYALLQEAGSGSKIADISNDSKFDVADSVKYPKIPTSGRQHALEFKEVAKEDVAQVWLANPDPSKEVSGVPIQGYKKNSLDIYWGNSQTDKAALAAKVIFYLDGVGYNQMSFNLDPDSTRASASNFTPVDCSTPSPPVTTNEGVDRTFTCFKNISGWPGSAKLMLVRFRLLYNTNSQPVAIRGEGCSDADGGCFIPPQVRIIKSTGTSGNIQRQVQVFTQEQVVPHYFDYALFSIGKINKE